jgi:Ca2+-binding RTX toxin-like protein
MFINEDNDPEVEADTISIAERWIEIDEGITAEDLVVERHGEDLTLRVSGQSADLTIKNWFHGHDDRYKVSRFVFMDGGELTFSEIEQRATYYGTDGDDLLEGYQSDADTLVAGAGNDRLVGGAGSDTYLFEGDFAADTIFNHDTQLDTTDVARFADASADDLWLSRDGDNLLITMVGTDNRVTVNNWYRGADYQLDSIEAGSSVLLNNKIDQLVSAMAAYSLPSGAGEVIPQDVKGDLQSVVAASRQSS